MHPLIPFTPLAVAVRAEMTFDQQEIRLKFEIEGDLARVRDALMPGTWRTFTRADELWRTTCFEAFWSVPGQPGYWELNLAPAGGRWNLYRFEAYRSPQPARASEDFEMLSIVTTADTLECRLRGQARGPFEASLCAVVRTDSGLTYYATKHAGAKADFHDRRSFVIT